MSKLFILLLIFLFSVVLRIWNLNQMGRTWDEAEYVEPGYKLIELLKKRDFNNSYFYTTYNHPPLVKYLYGITAHFDVEKIVNGKPIFRYDLTYSRLLSVFIFSLGVVMVVMIGWKVFSPSVGIISGVILSMMPFSLGLSQLVTTESFKIFVYSLTVYIYILLIEKFSWKRVLVAGIVTGLALQVKQSNFLLIFLLCIMFFFKYKKLKVKAVLSVSLIAVLVFILIWPQVLFHLKEVYVIHEKLWNVHFSPKIWQITLSPPEVFFGRLMLTPIFYYVVYFFISIPVLILFFFFMGVRQIFKKGNIYLLSILVWFLLPFSLSIYSWRQHGLRYIIEVYPSIAIISAIGIDFILHKKLNKKNYQLLLFLPVIFYLFVNLWRIKPYYLDYFNELVGGVNAVYKYKLFQIGWWGEGEREAGFYLKNNSPRGSTVGLALSPSHTFPKFDNLKYSDWSNKNMYDYVVVNHYHIIRDGFNDALIRKNYKIAYRVKADGAVLVVVYKRKRL